MSEEILSPCPVCRKMIDVAELFVKKKEIECPDCKTKLWPEITQDLKLIKIKHVEVEEKKDKDCPDV